MVFYSPLAEEDFALLLIGLINWKKHPLSREHAIRYITEIRVICDQLEHKTEHISSNNELKCYGNYVYRYRRNKNTFWLIFNNTDKDNNLYINRILSSHSLTTIKK
jgi:hypothetical protein